MASSFETSTDGFGGKSDGLRFAGTSWLQSIADQLGPHYNLQDQHLIIQSPGITFASLYEWISFVSIVDRIMRLPHVRSVQIDFTDKRYRLVEPKDFVAAKAASSGATKYDAEVRYSDRLYRLIGFLHAIGTRSILRRPHSDFFFSGITPQMESFKAFETNNDYSTVVFGLTKIASLEDSRRFLDENSILQWRENMGKKYIRSPLFQFDEIWRILSHELAINVWEHSGSTGFISARVVRPMNNGELLPFARMSYSPFLHSQLHTFGDFLELCIADCGRGIVATLEDSYKAWTRTQESPRASDVIAFAFDELGTCKSSEESWLTDRHALGRILTIVSKYGGAITVRCGGAEVVYLGASKMGFKRIANHLGYTPSAVEPFHSTMPGTHIQILLPLEPSIQTSEVRPRSVLVAALPESFLVDHSHVRGHLVPIKETLNLKEDSDTPDYRTRFRSACEQMCRSLVKRVPLNDPLILDFHKLNWTAPQFETFLHYCQNILQPRPVLLVQLNQQLAMDVTRFETERIDTFLTSEYVALSHTNDGTTTQLSERQFLETYSGPHVPLLGLDLDGQAYLFGMPTDASRDMLLDLIERDESWTVEELAKTGDPVVPSLLAVLNNTSSLFEYVRGRWRCVWSTDELRTQAKRAMQQNFDQVVALSGAWRGRPRSRDPKEAAENPGHIRLTIGSDKGTERFSLPWQNEWVWVKEFLESSRILTRGRYADEAAQLLIFRLRRFLESKDKSLAEVKVLAAVTSPAIFLASAMHRWWPIEAGFERPTVLDLGYSILRSTDAAPPALAAGDAVVMVQDVLSHGVVSGRMIHSLKKHGIEVTALIALVQLGDDEATVATDVLEWSSDRGVPHHAMIKMKRPSPCDAPEGSEGDARQFWIEPRTLRPFQYSMLRRALPQTSFASPPNDRRASNPCETEDSCLVRAGHYVIGDRHHFLGLDVVGAFQSEIGTQIATWIADICEGVQNRAKAPWESERGSTQFKGDVTFVLLPLDSQIHYLWPKVEEFLAQRGRRPLMCMLDATLFLGSGPVYRFPLQFTQFIYDAVFQLREARTNGSTTFKPIRILILDDAIATGRTALTILLALQRAVLQAIRFYGLDQDETPPIVEWIRYFAVFNRMNSTNDTLWRSMKSSGGELEIPFVFEDYLRFIGFPPPDERHCEQCAELKRIRLLKGQRRFQHHPVLSWLTARETELLPVVMDTKRAPQPIRLQEPIDVLTPRVSKRGDRPVEYRAYYADTAIGVFYTLMYQSYPPQDVLLSMLNQTAALMNPLEEAELVRYRWAVMEWAIRNWQRIIASGSQAAFFKCAKNELAMNSALLEKLFYSLGGLCGDTGLTVEELDGSSFSSSPDVRNPLHDFIRTSIDSLLVLEAERGSDTPSPDRIARIVSLEVGLNLFFLRLSAEIAFAANTEADQFLRLLLSYISKRLQDLKESELTFTRQLYTRWSRPEDTTSFAWSLQTIAESLFRERESEEEVGSADHVLLRGLLRKVKGFPTDVEYRRLLHGSLGDFLRALGEVRPYMEASAAQFISRAKRVMDWLEGAADDPSMSIPHKELRHCLSDLAQNGRIASTFRDFFCPSVKEIITHLATLSEPVASRLEFKVSIDPGSEDQRILVHRESLCSVLQNWTINPLNSYPGYHKVGIAAGLAESGTGRVKMRLRILTDYAPPEIAERNVRQGHGWARTESVLHPFNVEVVLRSSLTEREKLGGYTAAYDLLIPYGFMRKEP